MFGRIPQWSHLVQRFCLQKVLFFCYRFYFTSNDCSVHIICFSLILFWCTEFLETYPDISSRLSSFLANDCSYILFFYVCFCNVSCYFYHLSFLILCGSFLFSSYWACPEVYQFCLYLQRASSWCYFFFLLFFKPLLFLIFYHFTSFLLLTLSFVCSFSNSFRW